MTWILIADASLASFYREHRDGSLDPMRTIEHPAGRAHGRDLGTDRPGRLQKGSGRKSAFQPHSDPTDTERDHFLGKVIDVLAEALKTGECDSIVLIAPPRLLGRIRGLLPDAVARHVVDTLSLDLGRRSLADLPAALRVARAAQAATHPDLVPPVLHPGAAQWLPSSPR